MAIPGLQAAAAAANFLQAAAVRSVNKKATHLAEPRLLSICTSSDKGRTKHVLNNKLCQNYLFGSVRKPEPYNL